MKGNRIDPSLITYKVVSYEIVLDSYFTESDIVEGLADTRYVHHAIDAGKGQRFIAYGVYAETIRQVYSRQDRTLPSGNKLFRSVCRVICRRQGIVVVAL